MDVVDRMWRAGLAAAMPRVLGDELVASLRLVSDGLLRMPRVVIFASLCINVSSLLLPLVVMQVYDRVIPNQSNETLLALVLVTVGVLCCEAVIRSARSYVVFWSATRAAWRVHDDALARVMAAPVGWWSQESASRVVDRLKATVTLAEWQSSPSRLVLLDLPFVALFLLLMALVSGPLAAVPIIVFLVLGSLLWVNGTRLRKAGNAVAAADMRVNDFLSESLAGILAIKANALEPQMQRRHERLQNGIAAATREHIVAAEEARAEADLLASTTQVATMAFGALAVIGDHITIGTLACCTLLAGRAVQPLLRCIAMWSEVQAIAVDQARAAPILALEQPLRRLTETGGRGPLGLHLRKVSTPPVPDVAPALVHADLSIAPGGVCAVVGSGSPGSSPLTALLGRRLAPDHGTIELESADGLAPLTEVSSRILIVSALHRPVDGTLLDNLSGFRRGDAVTAAIDAARLIGLEDDVNLLPAGYLTRVGGALSNDVPDGIIRRLAVARAIALEPGLLVLDAVNEGLDTTAERQLARALASLRGRITTLILTNRPSFAAVADTVYRIENGRFTVERTPPPTAGGGQ